MNQFEQAIAALSAEIDAETASIEEARHALDKRERELAAKVEARNVMRRFAEGVSVVTSTVIAAPVAPVQTPAPVGEIDLSGLIDDSTARRRTLVDDVRDVVKRLGRQEFTNAHVEAAMRRLGIEIVGKTPRSRISLAFAKLVEEGTLARTFVGGGNVPHRYRVRAMMTPNEQAQADAMNKGQAADQSEATRDDEDQPSPDNVVKIA